MEKILLAALVAVLPLLVFSQTQEEKEQSRYEQMFSATGKLIKKEFTEVGWVRQGISIEIYRLSYPLEGKEMEKGIRVTAATTTSASTALIAQKDIEGCIQTLRLVGSELYTSEGTGYKEFAYTTSDNFRIGGYKDGKDFRVFMDVDNYRLLSHTQYFTIQEAKKLLDFFEQAKEMLKQ